MLNINQTITIYISPGIESTSGDALAEGVESYFTTEMSPLCATAQDARRIAGPHIECISDDVLNQLMYQYTLTAINMTDCDTSSPEWKMWASYWVTYKTLVIAISNTPSFIQTGEGKVFKQLGDFSVSRESGGSSTSGASELLEWLECEIFKYENAIRNCGAPLLDCLGLTDSTVSTRDYTPKLPELTVRGACDPNKPIVGRQWLYHSKGDTTGNARLLQFGRKYGVNKRW